MRRVFDHRLHVSLIAKVEREADIQRGLIEESEQEHVRCFTALIGHIRQAAALPLPVMLQADMGYLHAGIEIPFPALDFVEDLRHYVG